MNKLLMEENDRLQKQVSHLVYENGSFRKQTHTPAPNSIGIDAISHGCIGVAARACGLVGLDPTRVAEILKDRPSWYRDFRAVEVLNMLPTANGGTIELLYMQVCERSLGNTQNGPSMPPVHNFVRAEMLPSGYLIRPCEGGGSILHIVDHMNLEAWSIPEVLHPAYESSAVLAQKTTMAAIRQLRRITLEDSQPNVIYWGRRPAALRALSKKLSRGFNEALNGFSSESWSTLDNDGVDDVTILVNSSSDKLMGLNLSFADGFTSLSNAALCAKASMLLQSATPAVLLGFLCEHRSKWVENNTDAYSVAAVKVCPCSLPGARVCNFRGLVMLPPARTIEHEETSVLDFI